MSVLDDGLIKKESTNSELEVLPLKQKDTIVDQFYNKKSDEEKRPEEIVEHEDEQAESNIREIQTIEQRETTGIKRSETVK